MQRLAFLVLCLLASSCVCDESSVELKEEGKKTFGDALGESMKGMGDWFKGAAEDAKDKSESGVNAMRELADQAKDKSESGVDAMKGFAGGIGERFSKAKERLEETGENMKDALANAAEKSKDEFETAASKISKHAKEASDTVFSMFG